MLQGLVRQDVGNVHQTMILDADRLANELSDHILRNLAPNSEKVLRPFSSTEAAELLGVSMANLRKLHHDGKIPEVAASGTGRKLYTAQELLEIRHALAAQARNPLAYLPGRRAGERMHVICAMTFKGGSGKSTSTVHLAQRFALKGYRVLVVDMDPQASLSTLMGLRPEIDLYERGTIYDVLRYDADRIGIEKVIRPTHFPSLDLCPGGLILSEYETETPTALRQGDPEPFYTRLRSALNTVDDRYDLVFVDCPPQLGFLTLTAMTAATSLVVPVIPNMIDIASLAQFMTMASSALSQIANAGGEFDYDFMRYLLCRYEPTDGPQTQVSAFLRNMFPGRVMTSPFLKSTAIADAGLTSDTIYEIDRAQVNRATLNRALESINLVSAELERDLHKAWGRAV
ncbi:plasmid partitioning protein RepA (plasmid) [Limimaricola variabilis]|uniref:plasmid partitioning protein RepA n=1 Tax=Limimaricola variabilis TaxID=1492771 RepID=UPI002AC92BCC|nr:plasmid partitioning protein RepA [Limimaricola variabilis]WPY97004.1 plasmid partitioning protein RepA [Limimaricola variabilis]